MLRRLTALLVAGLGAALMGGGMPSGSGFGSASPVWPKGEETTLNFSCRFRGDFAAEGASGCVLRACSAYGYRVKLNGRFAGFGPARAAPGFFRMDEWKLPATNGVNTVEIEACGANNECFFFPRQTPFLQAEVLVGGKVKLATGRDFPAFTTERIRKVPRFSGQRHFLEAYRLPFAERPLELVVQPAKLILPRGYAYPTFEIDDSYRAISRERVVRDDTVPLLNYGVMSRTPSPNHYAAEEMDENPYYDVQRLRTVERSEATAAERSARVFRLADGEGVTFRGDVNRAGFARFRVTCERPCRIYLTFDELLKDDGSIDIFRICCANTAEWIFEKGGVYDVELIEPTAFKFARILAIGGSAEVTAPSVRTYESPAPYRGSFGCSDPELEALFKAAQRTLAANGVDCVTDCPTRERAGWCGDTFFTGKACSALTGDGSLEKLFLSNWLMPERFDAADDRVQLVPAVYPSNLRHTPHTYIPNFALWFILEVEDYVKRTGDRAFADGFRKRLDEVIAFFGKYENADGLLEKLPFWVFVEWSEANKLVQDVNYPSSMQYAAALDAMHRLYGRPDWAAKARRIRETVRRQSWTGEWFCDNAVRQPDGTLKLSGKCTETCQYYAMFFGVAPQEDFPELWRRMVLDFGPARERTGLWPQIYPSNFIFGRCIREEVLSRIGERRRVYDEMREHFLRMAALTGTLWEKNDQGACCSCCHGLASIAAVYLIRDVLGVREVDPVAKTIAFEPDASIPLEHCWADVPLPGGESAHLGWRRENGRLVESVRLPAGWSRGARSAAGAAAGIRCPAAEWKVLGADKPTLRILDGGVLEVDYVAGVGYGNLGWSVETGPDLVGFRWKERFLSRKPGARRFLWLCEPDQDLWRTEVTKLDAKPLADGWCEYFVPVTHFAFSPRGKKTREMPKANRVMMGFNFDDQISQVRDFTAVIMPKAKPVKHLPFAPKPSADAPRICVLDAGFGAPEALSALKLAGFSARAIGCDELAHADWFSKRSADLLVVPCSPFFPIDAVGNFKKFLSDGGAFFAYGGYAFDHLAEKPSDPRLDAPCLCAAEINGGKGGATINSRYGLPGDSVRIARDAVQVFQPNNLVEYAEGARACPMQTFLPPGMSWPYDRTDRPYHAAIADVGSGDPVLTKITGRWIPILDAVDRYGRRRGSIVSLVHNSAGPYHSSSWAFSAHPRLFRRGDAKESALFGDIVRSLLERLFIRTFSTEPISADPGAKVDLAVSVSAPDGASVVFSTDSGEIGRATVRKGAARLGWRAPSESGVTRLVARLEVKGRGTDVIETGLCVRGAPPAGERLVWKNSYFQLNGRPRYFCGVNNTGMPWFSEQENPLVWQRDFEAMADNALKMERLIHFSAASVPKGQSAFSYDPMVLTNRNANVIAKTDAIMQTANAAGVAPLVALHDWICMELEEDEFRVLADWDRFWVSRYREYPLLSWDMQNEIHPVHGSRKQCADKTAFDRRLTRLIDRFYDETGVSPVARAMKKGKNGLYPFFYAHNLPWNDLRARDMELFCAWLVSRWMKRISNVVHEVRPDVSVAPGFTRYDSCERYLDTTGMDYSVVHCYDEIGITRGNLMLADRRFEGKGLLMGEHGCHASHGARATGKDGNPDAEMTDYLLTQNLAFYGMGAACALYWTWKDNLGAEFPWGVNWPDLVPKRGVGVLRNLSILLGSGTPVPAKPELYFILPDGSRLGGASRTIAQNLIYAVDCLLRQNVPFGVINERNLRKLPRQATALIWPYALSPRSEDFAEVVAFVKRGGRLLLSGSPVYDHETRLPAHPERMAELGVGTNPNVVASTNVVEKQADDSVSKWYAHFLKDVAGLKPVFVPAAPGTGCCYALPQVDGVALVRDETPFLLRRANGCRVAALGRGGVPQLIENKGEPCGFLALDGKDLPESEMILALPFGPAERIRLIGARKRLVGEIGEFRASRWTRLEQIDGAVDFSVDEPSATDMRLFAAPEKLDEARRRAAALL